MATYPLAFPAIHPKHVKAELRRVQAATQSAFTLTQQVFDWRAKRWEISITMQTMDVEDAEAVGAFLHDLNGMVGTFMFDLTPWCPGVSPAPGVRVFRLSNPKQAWDSEKAVTWESQIDAVEAV